MSIHRLGIALFLIFLSLLPVGFHFPLQFASNSLFRLPVLPEVTVQVTQGNNQGDHIAANGSAYAFDFTVGQENFTITAAQGGTVIGVHDTSSIQCNGLDSEIAPQAMSLMHCWTQANFVLIADDDGKTAALYVHLLPYSGSRQMPKVTVGEHVNQGDPIGLAGTTGWSTGVHLHFQVESIPSQSQQSEQLPGWWWTKSLPISFSNPEVLTQDTDGIPQTGQTLTVSTNAQVNNPPIPNSTPSIPVPAPAPTQPPTPVPQPKVYHVAVDSSIPPPGVDTGITLTAGEQITITAQGWVTYGSNPDPTCDTSSNAVNIRVNPDGQRANSSGESCQPRMDQYISFPDSPVGELIAGIGSGTSQTWFAAGSSYTGIVSTSGSLYLVFNDGYYPDNVGQYQVTITVSPS